MVIQKFISEPSEPRNFDVRLISADVPDDSDRFIKAKLAWQPPVNVSGFVSKGYTVRYRADGEQTAETWKQFTTQHTEATASDLSKRLWWFLITDFTSRFFLEMGRTYEFRVAAENEQGLGKEAVNSLKTPDGGKFFKRLSVHIRKDYDSCWFYHSLSHMVWRAEVSAAWRESENVSFLNTFRNLIYFNTVSLQGHECIFLWWPGIEKSFFHAHCCVWNMSKSWTSEVVRFRHFVPQPLPGADFPRYMREHGEMMQEFITKQFSR